MGLQSICRDLLIELGRNPDEEHLKDTPRRWASFWEEFIIDYDPGNTDTTFESVVVDQMVVVSDIPFYSLCSHHLLPFYGEVSIGYIADNKVLGLSKFARIVQEKAHDLQVQERLAREIADEVSRLTRSNDVMVVIKAEHLCMQMRGIKSPGTMVTSDVRGRFRSKSEVRAEALRLIEHGR